MSDLDFIDQASPRSQNPEIQVGLWVVGAILLAGIAIAGFSIASAWLVA